MEINEHTSERGSVDNTSRHAQSQPELRQIGSPFKSTMIEKKKLELERVKQRQAKELRVILENEARMELIREENDRKARLQEQREKQAMKERMRRQ